MTPQELEALIAKREALEAPATAADVERMLETRRNAPRDQSFARIGQMLGHAVDSGVGAARDWTSDAMLGLHNAISGGSRRDEDLPELPGSLATDTGTNNVGYPLSLSQGNPQAQRDIVREQIPGAGTEYDRHGNVIMTMPPGTQMLTREGGPEPQDVTGKRYFVNRPGLSARDISEAGAEVAPDILAAVGGAKMGRGVGGLIGQSVGAAGGVGLSELAKWKASQGVGSEQPADANRVGLVMLLAAGGEMAAPVLNRVLRLLSRNKGVYKAGRLTPEGRYALQQSGVDPDRVTPEFLDEFDRLGAAADDPAQAAILADADSLPGGRVRLTKGDVTRQPSQQMWESQAEKGVYGESAERNALAFRKSQQNELRDNLGPIQRRIGNRGADPSPDTLSTEPYGGIERAQVALAVKRDVLHAQTKAAYTAAKEGGLQMSREGVEAASDSMMRALQEWPISTPKLASVRSLVVGLKNPGANVSAVKLKGLEQTRQQLSALRRSSDPVEAGAASAAVRAFDQHLDDALDTSLFRGDPAALAQMKEARRLHMNLKRRFSDNKVFAKLIEKTPGGDFLHTPQEALNFVFSANKLGHRTGAVRTLRMIKRELGEESPEWLSMKEEGVMRLFGAGESAARGEDLLRKFSGDKFASAMDEAMSRNGGLMRTLFSEDDISLLEQFKRTALRATNRISGGVNSSNTTAAAAQLMKGIDNLFGQLGIAVRGAARRVNEGLVAPANVDRAMGQGWRRPVSRELIPPGVGAAAAAQGAGPSRSNDR